MNAEVQKDFTAEKSATTTENSSKSTTQHRAKAAQTVVAGTSKVWIGQKLYSLDWRGKAHSRCHCTLL